MRTAFLLTGDLGLAEDLPQTARFQTYRRVMVSTQTSWARRLSHRELILESPSERDLLDDNSLTDRLSMWQALGTLPPRMRAVLVLRFYEDLSEADTASTLGCSAATVKGQTSRGLARLRLALVDHLDGDELGVRTAGHAPEFCEETP